MLRLGLKELVLRRVWRLERRERARLVGFRAQLAIARGAERSPALAPLMQLDAALGSVVGPETVDLRKAVRRLARGRTGGGAALLDVTRQELARDGLVTVERRRLLGLVVSARVRATADGVREAQALTRREDALVEALRDPVRAREAAIAAGGLVLLVSPSLLAELDPEIRGQIAGSGFAGDSSPGAFDDAGGLDPDFGDAFDPGIDAAVDSAGASGFGGDGGGDGGGGDGGGGDGGGGDGGGGG